MPKFTCTYTISPKINPDEATPVGDCVTVEAETRRDAGWEALQLPLPDGADDMQVHVSPEDLNEEAGFETFD